MSGWVILIIIMMIVLLLPSLYMTAADNASETYMRKPLEQFVLRANTSKCCGSYPSLRQYIVTGNPAVNRDLWYVSQ